MATQFQYATHDFLEDERPFGHRRQVQRPLLKINAQHELERCRNELQPKADNLQAYLDFMGYDEVMIKPNALFNQLEAVYPQPDRPQYREEIATIIGDADIGHYDPDWKTLTFDGVCVRVLAADEVVPVLRPVRSAPRIVLAS